MTALFGKFGLLRKGKRFITSTAAGEKWVWGHLRFTEVLLPRRKIGLVHWIGSHLIREPLGTIDLKKGAAGAVVE
jgi:hypothetical protein